MATIKYWNGSAWELAIVGKQGPAGPTGPTGPAGSASLQRFRFVATGGETSLSGTDANGNTLAYTAGLEEVFLNGAALVRGQDYIATNGTSITSLAALTATDVVEILAWGVFNVANTISNTLIDAKGDILAGSAADTVSRLAVGANDTVLTADSSTATGLKWAIASGTLDVEQIATGSLSGGTFQLTGLSNYDYIEVLLDSMTNDTGAFFLRTRINNNSTANNYSYNLNHFTYTPTVAWSRSTTATFFETSNIALNQTNGINQMRIRFINCKSAGKTSVDSRLVASNASAVNFITNTYGIYLVSEAVSTIEFLASTGNFNGGTYTVWGA